MKNREQAITSLSILSLSTEGLQMRVRINRKVVSDYAHSLAEGVNFPPVLVVDTGDELLLADGYHRLEAHRLLKRNTIECLVLKGSRRDAITNALQANSQHGLQRTNADKRNALKVALTDQEWSQWSSRELAQLIGVSNAFVARYRQEAGITHETVQYFRNGKTYKQRTRKSENIKQVVSATHGSGSDSNVTPFRQATNTERGKTTRRFKSKKISTAKTENSPIKFTVRLTPIEHSRLTELSKDLGLSAAQLLRKAFQQLNL